MRLSMFGAAFLAIVCVLVVFSVSTNSRNSILVKEFVFVAAGAAAGAVLGISMMAGARLRLNRIPLPAAVSLPLVLALMAAVHFAGPVGSVNGPFTMATLASLCFLGAFGAAVLEHRHCVLLSLFVTLVTMFLFIYTILQSRGVNLFPWDSGLTRTGRSSGSLGNPNLLGAFSAAMLPFGAATILSSVRNRSLRVGTLLVFCFGAVAAVIASGTRGSLIGVLSGILFLTLWLFRRARLTRRGRQTAVLSAVLLCLLAILPMRNRLSELSSVRTSSGTAQVRRVIWDGGLRMFLDRPLAGWGPGSFQIIFPFYRNPDYSILGVSHNTLHAHCEYLEILCDIGIAGLLLWGVFLAGMARRIRGAGLLGAGAAAGAVSMLSENLVSVSLRWPPTAWLFGFLCMVYLVREEQLPRASGKAVRTVMGAVVACAGLMLGIFAFRAYPAAMEAARLVFAGKDVHLTGTEAPMSAAARFARAYSTTGDPAAASAAANAWITATVHADSAIALCGRAASVDPSDLSALYALGSAYLTRAILASPADPLIAAALARSGTVTTDPAAARRFNQMGMETYATLTGLAPNYAETHNNMAIGHMVLGNVPGCLDELYLAWRLHGHRRPDYLQQTLRLMRVVPGSRSGALLIWSHLAQELSLIERDGRTHKTDLHRRNMADLMWFLLRASDSPDQLHEELMEIAGSHSGAIDSISRSAPSPDEMLEQGRSAIEDGRAQEGLAHLQRLHELQNYIGAVTPTMWPGLGTGYASAGDAVEKLGWSAGTSEAFLAQMLLLFRADIIVNSALNLSSGTNAASVRQGVRDSLQTVFMNLGGPRAAAMLQREEPWLEGSMLDRMETSLRLLTLSEPQDAELSLIELRFYFLSVAALWLEGTSFDSGQNDYLLERLFEARDRTAGIMGAGATAAISRALESELQRVQSHLDQGSFSVLVELRRDLAGMVPRFPD